MVDPNPASARLSGSQAKSRRKMEHPELAKEREFYRYVDQDVQCCLVLRVTDLMIQVLSPTHSF